MNLLDLQTGLHSSIQNNELTMQKYVSYWSKIVGLFTILNVLNIIADYKAELRSGIGNMLSWRFHIVAFFQF